MPHGVWRGSCRCTWGMNKAGMIKKVMPKVKPDTNAEEILAYLAGKA